VQKRKSANVKNVEKNPFDKVRFKNFGSIEEAMYVLIKDLNKMKVHLPENFSPKVLENGCGEAVCFIINDLTNRELIARKYTFLEHKLEEPRQDYYMEQDPIDDIDPYGSTVFAGSEVSDIHNI
jgi:hypothetical protein